MCDVLSSQWKNFPIVELVSSAFDSIQVCDYLHWSMQLMKYQENSWMPVFLNPWTDFDQIL